MSEQYRVVGGHAIKTDFLEQDIFAVIGYNASNRQLHRQRTINNVLEFLIWMTIIMSLLLTVTKIITAEVSTTVGIFYYFCAIVILILMVNISTGMWYKRVMRLSLERYASHNIMALQDYTQAFLDHHYKTPIAMDQFSLSTDNHDECNIRLNALYTIGGQAKVIDITLVTDNTIKALKVKRFEITDNRD